MSAAESTLLDERSLRDAVRNVCAAFGDAYWRELDRDRAYPDKFVAALTKAGFLAALMAKPANSVMMTFAADPQLGLSQDRFSGSAIVFVSTVTYPLHTAYLQ